MKLKFKMPPNHFAILVQLVGQLPLDKIPCSDLDIINLKYFYIEGCQLLTRFGKEGLQKKYPLKERTVNIDVNHYIALKNVLSACGDDIAPLTKSIFIGLKSFAEPEILRQVSHFKLIG